LIVTLLTNAWFAGEGLLLGMWFNIAARRDRWWRHPVVALVTLIGAVVATAVLPGILSALAAGLAGFCAGILYTSGG
jgi:hypothetical protein